MSSSEICYCVKTYTPTPKQKLIGFGSFEKLNLKLARGSGPQPPSPGGQLRSVVVKQLYFVTFRNAGHAVKTNLHIKWVVCGIVSI